MRKFWVIMFVLISGMVNAAELKVFTAGSPILASEINANFAELEARINALNAQVQSASAGIPGQPFNYYLETTDHTLGAGFKYYITDVLIEENVLTQTCSGGSSVSPYSVSSNVSGLILKISPIVMDGGTSCIVGSSRLHLTTPILVPGGEVLTHAGKVRIIGYRIAD